MGIRKLFRITLWVQGVYTLVTAAWGLVDIDSFMAVTGPKNDIWLVKTVSVILLAVGASLIAQLFTRSHPLPVIILALFTSAGLAAVEHYYSGKDVISWVYGADGVLQVTFALVWTYLLVNRQKLSANGSD